jgi:hypothetical protein
MSEIYMIRTQSGLTPSDPTEWDKLAGDRIKMGSECRCNITVPRNLKFHRKFFAMIGEAFEMQDKFSNKEHWRDAVLIAAGHCDTFITHEGNVNYRVKSISFARCDDTKFARIYNDTIQAIVDHWLTSEPDQYKLILGFM